jgi:iron complex transport system ATP-binding protein
LGRWDWEDDDDIVLAMQALDATGMKSFAQRDVLTLSGGERQRVALAMLLAQQPRLLLLDEPASHQDLQHQVRIFALLRKLADDGHALVAAVHDINLAARFATHALLMDGAGGVEAGLVADMLTPERLSRIFHHPVRQIDDAGRAWFVAG